LEKLLFFSYVENYCSQSDVDDELVLLIYLNRIKIWVLDYGIILDTWYISKMFYCKIKEMESQIYLKYVIKEKIGYDIRLRYKLQN
jgi:hypothetical protein